MRDMTGFWMSELPIASTADSADMRYTVENRYTGETFEGLDAYEVEELLNGWLAEDGYERSGREDWRDYRWADYADGYVVYRCE